MVWNVMLPDMSEYTATLWYLTNVSEYMHRSLWGEDTRWGNGRPKPFEVSGCAAPSPNVV